MFVWKGNESKTTKEIKENPRRPVFVCFYVGLVVIVGKHFDCYYFG